MPKTNSEILTEAINLAIKNGWQAPGKLHRVSNWSGKFGDPADANIYIWFEAEDHEPPVVSKHIRFCWEQIVFNHDFAKALWGDKLPEQAGDYYYNGPNENYLWHLQQMVIADDPVKYLGEHI